MNCARFCGPSLQDRLFSGFRRGIASKKTDDGILYNPVIRWHHEWRGVRDRPYNRLNPGPACDSGRSHRTGILPVLSLFFTVLRQACFPFPDLPQRDDDEQNSDAEKDQGLRLRDRSRYPRHRVGHQGPPEEIFVVARWGRRTSCRIPCCTRSRLSRPWHRSLPTWGPCP